jgi:hypothetical protein
MTYKPEMKIGPKSPGVWKELRRLEANEEMLVQTAKNRKREVERLRGIEKAAQALCADTPGRQEWKDLRAALAKEGA